MENTIKVIDNYDSEQLDAYMKAAFPRMARKIGHMEYKLFNCDGFPSKKNKEWVKECLERESFHVA